ncbi:MAG: imidazoleglycerol-phosphate dehydratase HisB [Catalinimonas sp.]
MKRTLYVRQEAIANFSTHGEAAVRFVPGAIVTLHRLTQEANFRFVLIRNEESSALPQMLATLSSADVRFEMQVEVNKETAEVAPGDYLVGTTPAHAEIAERLGAESLLINADAPLATWPELYRRLRFPDRVATVHRKTRETDVFVQLNLDGTGQAELRTGLSFFDHMLDQLARHGGVDLTVRVEGDLHVDEHHTVEDTALGLGEAFLKALGDKRGIERYGFLLPMDDALAQVAIDFSGRNWLLWDAEFRRERIGDLPTEMFYHFFKSFSDAARCNLNVRVEGDNEHHKIEAIFKAWARAIRRAVARDPRRPDQLPSTKGSL